MKNSDIEWTVHTFNPWCGCTKVSEGCANCYAELMMDKRYGRVHWGKGQPRVRTSTDNWRQPLVWNKRCSALGKRERVFCASPADVFDEEVADEWRDELFSLVRACQNLDWLLLTKRPVKMHDYLLASSWWIKDPLFNVWLGVSVENQKRAEERIPFLIKTPARVRFLSCEPLLGPLELDLKGVHWVIAGGESGPHARPMHPEWARRLRGQCKLVGVPFFFKQWGEFIPASQFVKPRMTPEKSYQVVDGEVMVRVGKKPAGRTLDGREWNDVPMVNSNF